MGQVGMLIAGLDEVGWGSWAGPIVSVAAAFDDTDLSKLPLGVRDSKLCSAKERAELANPICAIAKAIGIGVSWPQEIDTKGPAPSLELTYSRALQEMSIVPDLLIVDGNRTIKDWVAKQVPKPKADRLHIQVAAASIVAKNFRDGLMIELGRVHPKYNWVENKGYGTKDHQQAIAENGLLIDSSTKWGYLHRLCYCRKFLSRLPSETLV